MIKLNEWDNSEDTSIEDLNFLIGGRFCGAYVFGWSSVEKSEPRDVIVQLLLQTSVPYRESDFFQLTSSVETLLRSLCFKEDPACTSREGKTFARRLLSLTEQNTRFFFNGDPSDPFADVPCYEFPGDTVHLASCAVFIWVSAGSVGMIEVIFDEIIEP